MTKIALVTGASSGIGLAFARQLAAERFDLVVVARDKERLERTADELKSRHGVNVEVLPADLSESSGIRAVSDRLANVESPIDLLVNNAGFGAGKSFTDMTAAEHEAMIDVNVKAVVLLAHAAINAMKERRTGNVINVSSVAGYLPGLRGSATYAATKAFVTAFTEGLAPVIAGSGVHVSALCPGYVKTEFHARAGIPQKKQSPLLWLKPEHVVKISLDDHRKGRIVSIPTARYKAMVLVARLAPRGLILRVMSRMGKR